VRLTCRAAATVADPTLRNALRPRLTFGVATSLEITGWWVATDCPLRPADTSVI
jgi:hypothetical protein